MHFDTQAYDLDGTTRPIRLSEFPDTCPQCHRSVHPKFITAQSFGSGKVTFLDAVFRCTHSKCHEVFIGYYRFAGGANSRPEYLLKGTAPRTANATRFSAVIQGVSPTFCEIYNQAEEADSAKLDQLVGIGLRKALEFLVKDFASHDRPNDEKKIRETMLGPCITQFIDDPNVKECARRAAWLGNDETHYTRRWEDRDISDLKLLVRLTVNWVENSLLTKKYIEEMQAGQ